MLDLTIPVYGKYFSDQEVKDLTKFYESPLGRKAVTAVPQIMTETQALGRQWGEKIGRETMQEVLAEHPDLAAQLKAASK